MTSNESYKALKKEIERQNLLRGMAYFDYLTSTINGHEAGGMSFDGDPKRKRKALIPNPYGWEGYNSLENFIMTLEYIDLYGLDGHVFEDKDPSNKAAQVLIKTTCQVLPTGVLITNSHRLRYGSDPYSGDLISHEARIGAAWSIITLPVPGEIGSYIRGFNLIGIPFEQ